MAILKLKNKTTGEWEEIQAIKGNGISSIEKTATVGNKDTYTIYFTNGETTTYEVENGEVTREELERLSMIYNAFPSTTGEGEEPSINGTAEVPFKEIGLKGNTSQDGEPTPDTPIPVNVVSGNNSIKIVGKNLCNNVALSNSNNDIFFYFDKNISQTFTLSATINSATSSNSIYLILNGSSLGKVGEITGSANTKQSVTITFTNEIYEQIQNSTTRYLQLYKNNAGFTLPTDAQIENGSSNTEYEEYKSNTYEVNLGNIELNKIGDYQDSIKKSTGKNLAEEKISNANVYNDGRLLVGDYDIYIAKIEQNKTYTVSTNDSQFNAGFFITKPELGSTAYDNLRLVQTSKTFTAPITGYIAFRTNSGYQFAMINEGSTALPYEPYGKVWYKYGAIGKVVLDGSENWTNYTNLGNNSRCYYIKPNAFSLNSQLFSNYFIKSNLYETDETGIIINPYGTSLISIKIPNSDLETQDLAGYKTWLSTHNTTVYYVLATPTITPITDTTLIEQLDNLEKAYSYDTQTNILQTNQDKPFIISYEAILSLRNVLNNLETRIAVLETE